LYLFIQGATVSDIREVEIGEAITGWPVEPVEPIKIGIKSDFIFSG
jgi:hypothetical protein